MNEKLRARKNAQFTSGTLRGPLDQGPRTETEKPDRKREGKFLGAQPDACEE